MTVVVDNFLNLDNELGQYFLRYQMAVLNMILKDGVRYLYNNFDPEGALQIQDNLANGIIVINETYNSSELEERKVEFLDDNEDIDELISDYMESVDNLNTVLFNIRDMVLQNQFRDNQHKQEVRARLRSLTQAFKIVIQKLRRNYFK